MAHPLNRIHCFVMLAHQGIIRQPVVKITQTTRICLQRVVYSCETSLTFLSFPVPAHRPGEDVLLFIDLPDRWYPVAPSIYNNAGWPDTVTTTISQGNSSNPFFNPFSAGTDKDLSVACSVQLCYFPFCCRDQTDRQTDILLTEKKSHYRLICHRNERGPDTNFLFYPGFMIAGTTFIYNIFARP